LDLLVIADFGIAHFGEEYLHTLVRTDPHARLANFQYAAPEQRRPGQVVDHRADIYALGLILNEMFTREVIQGTGYRTIGSVAPDYAYLDKIVETMVRQSPDERPASIKVVKQQLIARGNEFISMQRLTKLKNTVVPSLEVDDPLINDPPQLVEVDYRQDQLILILSQPVTKEWLDAFVDLPYTGGSPFIVNSEPSKFRFRGNEAMIPLPTRGTLQQLVDRFKYYLTGANNAYRNQVLNDQRRMEMEERKRLQEEIQEEERRQMVLKSIKV